MIIDAFFAARRELVRRRRRSAIVIAGFALAAAVMIVLLSLTRIQYTASAELLTRTGTHFIAFAPYGATGYSCPECRPVDGGREGFFAETVATGLLPISLIPAIAQLGTVRDVSPYLLYRFDNPDITAGGFDTWNTVAVRTTTCAPANVVKGRFLQAGESDVVMVEEAYSRTTGLGVGDSLLLGPRSFSIVGVVNTGIRPVKADVYLDIEDLTDLVEIRIGTSLGGRYNILLVEAASAQRQRTAMDAVQRLIGQGGLLSTYNCYIPAAEVMGMEASSLKILTLVIVLAAMLFSLITQYAAIQERRKEIGIFKTIGWSNRHLAGQVIWEGLLLSAAGFLVGTAAAIGALLTYKGLGTQAAGDVLFADIILAAMIVVTSGGVVAGCIPAYAAARQNPAEALRCD